MNPVSDVCVLTVLTHLLPFSCAGLRLLWRLPAAQREREPVTTTAILLTCFSQLDFSTALLEHT